MFSLGDKPILEPYTKASPNTVFRSLSFSEKNKKAKNSLIFSKTGEPYIIMAGQ
jgi:hypothetical protein